MNNTCQLPVEQIHDLCDMHLVYLGHNTYGKLREKSTITPPIEVTQVMVNEQLNRISSLHRIVDSLITAASSKQLPPPQLVETGISSEKDPDDTVSVSTLEPIFSSDTEPSDLMTSSPSRTSSPNVPQLVETLNINPDLSINSFTALVSESLVSNNLSLSVMSTSLATPRVPGLVEMLDVSRIPFATSVAGPIAETAPTTASSTTLQSLCMLAQSTLVNAGIPLLDPETIRPYNEHSNAAILVRKPHPEVIERTNTFTVCKLCDLSYAVVSHHNLLALTSTSTEQRQEKKDQDIVVLGEAHILDYDKYLQSVASTNKSIVVLTQLT